MIPLPASAEPAANAGTGPEGRKRSSSVDSGASSDATMVASDINWIDGADMGAVDGCHKLVAIEEALTSPPERAACNEDPEVHDAQRGRVSTDTASGAPALASHTNTAGSPTAAAPITVSIYTATALAVADPYVSALSEPNEAPNGGNDEGAPAHSTAAVAAHDAAAAATSSVTLDGVFAAGTPAPASSAILGPSIVHNGLAPARASSSTAADDASALGAAACESATIDANPTSRGDAGGPETPVISRRSHVVAGAVPIRAFAIGRTSTAAPAPQAGGSKSAVIVANATSRGGAHCPPTPVVSRQPVPRSHAISGTAALPAVHVNGGQYTTFCIGRRSSAPSTAPPAIAPATATATAPADPLVLTPAPALPPMPATALSPMRPQSSPARIGLLRSVSRVIQRGIGAIRDALIAMYADGIGPTNAGSSTSPGLPDEDGCWDEGAPIGAALLELRRRERRRFL